MYLRTEPHWAAMTELLWHTDLLFWKVSTIAHPPLEVFITVDEEIGLLGAVGFDCSVLKGRRFINLDSEAEGSLWISCAGGTQRSQPAFL